MQLLFLKTLVIVGTLSGVVFAQGGYYHKHGYKHKGNGVIKRTILIDGCTGEPVREQHEQHEQREQREQREPAGNDASGARGGNAVSGTYTGSNGLTDYDLEQYADEIEELGRQLGIEDLGH